MGFKRKRSVDESPMSVSSFAGFATPDAQSPTPIPNGSSGMMDVDAPASRGTGWDFSNLGRIKSSDWGLRTRKRVRDNRPDEHIIHAETTINKLFSAQRNQPHAEPILSDTLPAQQAPVIQKSQKSTLHAFWKIPAPPVQLPFAQMQPQREAEAPRCEDCDTLLEKDAIDMDVDMDVDGPLDRCSLACSDCGRSVCGKCAVVTNARHCLQCATSARNPKRWW
ncbi:uncharacterized protein CC84DRAFT_1139438 [Paraphaeosphaeria sporulosa]|uniref:Uncharacterized protein n=1 Tax=Paraphaeosphaeria sporulosa TaxID=1460663 RepID=A0A177CUL7_9PLEO|nr:uncharacterized protein CC84DRAFT_1139438 [Paraphaeosphaeria sporulosa]OAG10708.1 hypothetical protein CC84DRAFT_1139438 [Paraphaeosphaeria sporulosa]